LRIIKIDQDIEKFNNEKNILEDVLNNELLDDYQFYNQNQIINQNQINNQNQIKIKIK
jgi:hypothetical protein